MKGLLARAAKNAPVEGSEADAAVLSKLAKKQTLLADCKSKSTFHTETASKRKRKQYRMGTVVKVVMLL